MKPRHLKDWHRNELIEEVRRLRYVNRKMFSQWAKATGNDKGQVTTAETDAALSHLSEDVKDGNWEVNR